MNCPDPHFQKKQKTTQTISLQQAGQLKSLLWLIASSRSPSQPSAETQLLGQPFLGVGWLHKKNPTNVSLQGWPLAVIKCEIINPINDCIKSGFTGVTTPFFMEL